MLVVVEVGAVIEVVVVAVDDAVDDAAEDAVDGDECGVAADDEKVGADAVNCLVVKTAMIVLTA